MDADDRASQRRQQLAPTGPSTPDNRRHALYKKPRSVPFLEEPPRPTTGEANKAPLRERHRTWSKSNAGS